MKGGERGRLGFQTWFRIFGMLQVGLQEPNLGKTNPRVSLLIRLRFVLHSLLRTRLYF
jgi:hypothetical protein